MPRGIRKVKAPPEGPASKVPKESVHDRIRTAERALLSGATERVLVNDADLEKLAGLISEQGLTKALLLKKAVHLGLQVISINPTAMALPHAALSAGEMGGVQRGPSDATPYVGQANFEPGASLPVMQTGDEVMQMLPKLLRGGGRWRDGAAEGALPEAPALFDRLRVMKPGEMYEATEEELNTVHITDAPL